MSVTVYVPNDSAAIGLGANATAQAISKIAAERGISIRLIRNGSRGLFWLEPFVEVVTTEGRIGYGPVEAHDVPSLFDAQFLQGDLIVCDSAPLNPFPISPGRSDSPSAASASPILSASPTTRPMAEDAGCVRHFRPNLEILLKRFPSLACAGAAAQRFRPASSGRPSSMPAPSRSTSCATPTKAIRAPSRIG